MTADYPVPARAARAELVVQGSRFLARIERAPTAAAAREVIDRIRAEHADATHNAWAYVAGPPASTAQIGMSDDGEVKGTAGRPMLQILLHSDVGELVAVVTRYYGGTKLGTGGLVRAYSAALKEALAALSTAIAVERCRVEIETTYAHVDAVRRALSLAGAQIVAEQFAELVELVAMVPTAGLPQLKEAVRAASAGGAQLTVL